MKARIGSFTVNIPDTVRGGVTARHNQTVGEASPSNTRAAARVAGAIPAPAPQYDSKWEERYAKQLDTLKLAGEIVRWWYHSFSMWLPGRVRYTPDFMVQHHGHIQIVEVKGWSKNLRDGMTRLKVAAGIFTCYQWSMAKWNGRGFDLTDVYGGTHERDHR